MKPMDLMNSLGHVKSTYVVEAQAFREGKANVRHLSLRKAMLIAAAIVLSLLLVGCAVVYVLSLQDMVFGEEVREYYDGSSQERTLLSIQGVEGTPGYQATKEWYEWLQTYDTDQAIYHSEEAFSEDFGDAYYAYNLYSREMKDKLDEICARYGLALLGKMYVDPDVEAACQALQIQGIFRPDALAEADWGNVCYYENGSFDVEGYVTLTGADTPWPHTQIVSLRCHRKDDFSYLYGSIGPAGTYEEWTYTTSDGVDVLMVMEKGQIRGHSFMMVDRGPYVFLFSTYESEDGYPMSREGLEAFAEVFDFTVEPQRVSQADLEKTDERREEADAAFAEEQGKKLHSFNVKGYDARIKFQMENCTHPDQLGFAVMDLEGNGSEDLLVGENGYIRAVYTKVDGGTQHMMPLSIAYLDTISYGTNDIGVGVMANASYIYLCQGNSLAYVYDFVGDGVAYHFAKVKDGELVWADRIVYAPDNAYYAGKPWQRYDDNHNSEPITEEEFNRILSSYVRVPVEYYPISEFPLAYDSPSGIGTPDTVYGSFDEFVRDWTELDQDLSDWSYSLTDLDGDGQEELIWGMGAWKGVFTMENGQVKLLEGGVCLTICENGIIESICRYLDGNETYCWYRVEGSRAVLVDYLRRDAQKDPGNPWFRSTDGQDVSLVPISQAEFDAIRAKYTPADLDSKPVSDYPLR